MSETWSYRDAEQLLRQHEADFRDCDFVPRIVGSVALKGASDNDLDIALSPLQPMTLEDGIKRLKRLLPVLGIGNKMDRDFLFNPAADEEHGWFANALYGGRVIEFYFPADSFPVSD